MVRLTLQADDALDQSSKVVCITGTGTGVGKTVVTGLLAKEYGKSELVVTQKWVQSGDLQSPDIQVHDALSNQTCGDVWAAQRQVYSFEHPVSPHLAAELSNASVDINTLMNATHVLKDNFDRVLVETSGGIMVPLTRQHSFADALSMMSIPTIVVVPNQLGCINHALLTLSILQAKHIPVMGFIMNHWGLKIDAMHHDNPRIIADMSNAKYLGDVWCCDETP
jgi:dethiobiotin synthetase